MAGPQYRGNDHPRARDLIACSQQEHRALVHCPRTSKCESNSTGCRRARREKETNERSKRQPARARPALDQHASHPRRRSGRKGQIRPPWSSARLRPYRLPAVHQDYEARSVGSKVVRSRPFRSLERARVRPAIRRVAPFRLRPADGAAQAVPPVGFAHARTPGVWRDPGYRGHYRPARTGPCRSCRPRHRGEASLRRLQPRKQHSGRSPHLRLLRRRRPDGGHLARGLFAGWNAGPRQADRLLRRQPDLAGRTDRALLYRECSAALRGVPLARAARGRR